MKKTTAVVHANGPNLHNETPLHVHTAVLLGGAADPNRLNGLGKA
jgi:hypothetical protein